MHIYKLQPKFFEQIKSGKKTFEVRVNDEKRQALNVGDRIIFKKLPQLIETVVTKVVELKYFDNFDQMSRTLDLCSLGFDKGTSAEDVSREYYQFYTPMEENTYGIVAIKIQLVK